MKKHDNARANAPRGHEFDGIREYDNDLPRWWVGLFVVTIVFAIGYMLWYHLPVMPALTLADELEAEQALLAQAPPPAPPAGSDAVAFDYDTAFKDAAFVARGKELFAGTCFSCHGAEGQGQIGPNLTDDFWIYGARPEDIEKSILNGAPEKGMPAWREVVGVDGARALVGFIRSIQRTSPAGAKAAQGNPGVLP